MGAVSNMKRITQQEVLDFIQKIETGEITLSPVNCIPQEVYAGDVPYTASNGWNVTVFNDCGDWDYFDSIQKGGQSLSYEYLVHFMPKIAHYRPSDEIAWTRYGIPGYITFRCLVCGVVMKSGNDGNYCNEHKGK